MASERERRDFCRFCKFFTERAIQIVVQSRQGRKMHSRCRVLASGADWFNMNLEENQEITREIRKSLENRYPPDVTSVCVDVSLRTAEGDRLDLENWCVCFDDTEKDDGIGVVGHMYHRLSTLIRSVLCATRVTPTYKYYAKSQGPYSFVLCYQVYEGAARTKLLGPEAKSIRLGFVPCPYGTLKVTLTYRTKMIISPMDRSGGAGTSGLASTIRENYYASGASSLPHQGIADTGRAEPTGEPKPIMQHFEPFERLQQPFVSPTSPSRLPAGSEAEPSAGSDLNVCLPSSFSTSPLIAGDSFPNYYNTIPPAGYRPAETRPPLRSVSFSNTEIPRASRGRTISVSGSPVPPIMRRESKPPGMFPSSPQHRQLLMLAGGIGSPPSPHRSSVIMQGFGGPRTRPENASATGILQFRMDLSGGGGGSGGSGGSPRPSSYPGDVRPSLRVGAIQQATGTIGTSSESTAKTSVRMDFPFAALLHSSFSAPAVAQSVNLQQGGLGVVAPRLSSHANNSSSILTTGGAELQFVEKKKKFKQKKCGVVAPEGDLEDVGENESSSDESFVKIDVRPALASRHNASDLGHFVRECKTAPPELKSFSFYRSNSCGQPLQPPVSLETIPQELKKFQEQCAIFDQFVKSLSEQGPEDDEEKEENEAKSK